LVARSALRDEKCFDTKLQLVGWRGTKDILRC
jgi:hypothetical protein